MLSKDPKRSPRAIKVSRNTNLNNTNDENENTTNGFQRKPAVPKQQLRTKNVGLSERKTPSIAALEEEIDELKTSLAKERNKEFKFRDMDQLER